MSAELTFKANNLRTENILEVLIITLDFCLRSDSPTHPLLAGKDSDLLAIEIMKLLYALRARWTSDTSQHRKSSEATFLSLALYDRLYDTLIALLLVNTKDSRVLPVQLMALQLLTFADLSTQLAQNALCEGGLALALSRLLRTQLLAVEEQADREGGDDGLVSALIPVLVCGELTYCMIYTLIRMQTT